MGEFIDAIHEEIVTEAECADETDGTKERAEVLYRWADKYRAARAALAKFHKEWTAAQVKYNRETSR